MPAIRRSAAEPWLIAAALAIAYLIAHPQSADYGAQLYRTELFRREGFTLWDGQWFGGHHTLGYSVLFPALAALLGARVVGALSAVAAAVLFERLAASRFEHRARLGAVWFGAATATNLYSGRLSFGLGVAVGLGAVLGLQRRRRAIAIVLAAACSLSSPVAGLFLALAAGSVALADPSRRRLAVAVAASAAATVLMLAVAFPEGGGEPFAASAFLPIVALAVAVLAVVPRAEATVRTGAVLYAGASVLAFVVSTPMGGNATRLGMLFAGPVLACVLWRRRSLVLAVLALPLLYWQWMPPVRDLLRARADPSVSAAYYHPLEAYLSRHGGAATRVEIPATYNHFESVRVAPRFALARGWERQLDVRYNGLFYAHALSVAKYRAWLARNAVGFVALPDARLDYAAHTERALIESRPSYLELAWRDRHWLLFRVVGASPIVSPPGRLVHLGPDSFTLRAARAGALTVRMRFTPYWYLERGTGCVERGPNGFTRLALSRPGRVRVVTHFALGRVVDHGPRCTTPD